MNRLPAVTVLSDARFVETPACVMCAEDQDSDTTPLAEVVVNGDPLCRNCADDEIFTA